MLGIYADRALATVTFGRSGSFTIGSMNRPRTSENRRVMLFSFGRFALRQWCVHLLSRWGEHIVPPSFRDKWTNPKMCGSGRTAMPADIQSQWIDGRRKPSSKKLLAGSTQVACSYRFSTFGREGSTSYASPSPSLRRVDCIRTMSTRHMSDLDTAMDGARPTISHVSGPEQIDP